MVELNTPIEKIIKDNRCIHRLREHGYVLYSDLIGVTLDDLRKIPGMGEVSVQRVYEFMKEAERK